MGTRISVGPVFQECFSPDDGNCTLALDGSQRPLGIIRDDLLTRHHQPPWKTPHVRPPIGLSAPPPVRPSTRPRFHLTVAFACARRTVPFRSVPSIPVPFRRHGYRTCTHQLTTFIWGSPTQYTFTFVSWLLDFFRLLDYCMIDLEKVTDVRGRNTEIVEILRAWQGQSTAGQSIGFLRDDHFFRFY